jgi:fructokinase
MKIELLAENMNKPVCVGTGLVALDVIISNKSGNFPQFLAGGTCGNVLTILSYLGWHSYPVARLSNNVACEMLIDDLVSWHVHDDLITVTKDGSTPIIIHRILTDKQGAPKHRFEFRNPEDGTYLPSYKPCLASSTKRTYEQKQNANVFFFDRINRASIELAKLYKKNGAIIVFEPSSAKDEKQFKECLQITDVIKFSDDRITNYEEMYPMARVPLEIQTLGRNGLKFRRQGDKEWTTLSSYSIDDVIDAAGAGDWLTAGFIKKLFSRTNNIKDMPTSDIISSLEFGQILSSLNCTFEGARGLMYALNNNELMLYVQHILSLKGKQILHHNKLAGEYQRKENTLKISSLFNSIP